MRLALATVFSVLVFLSKFLLPTPIDKMLVIIEAVLLGLSALLIDRLGGAYTGLISGLLLTLLRSGFAPFSLLFAVVYGVMMDLFFHALNVRVDDTVKVRRVILASTLSTAMVGVASMYVTYSIGLMPMVPALYLLIILVGSLNGAGAGYLISTLWNKYLVRLQPQV